MGDARANSVRCIPLLSVALVIFLSFSAPGVAQQIQALQTFYIPITEDQCYSAMRAISQGSPGPLPATNMMFSAWGIVPSESNTIVVYDHQEDGYEADPSSPTQSTTQIWGDGNTNNGVAPGYPSDLLGPGSYISLTNTMSVPRDIAELRYDGCDKLLVNKPIAAARAQYALDPGQVLAGAVQAPDVTRYGVEFVAPIGTNVNANQAFEYTAMTVIAARDNTLVSFDINADGVTDTQIWLDEGETFMVTNVVAGARVTATRPVQAHLLTGDIGSYYRMRWYMLLPTYQWDTEYYAPVGSRTNADGSATYVQVYLYNRNTNSITVFIETLSGTVTTSIVAGGTAGYQMPFETGGRFYTTNGQVFSGIAVCDSVSQSREWGYALMPKKMLTTAAICGWGQGSGDLSQNANPVWAVAESKTTVYIDWDSNPETGPFIDPYGRHYNESTNVVGLGMIVAYDNSGDNDQGGLRVYSYSNRLATAWGEDPAMSTPYNPYLDMGCEVLAIPSVLGQKTHALIYDANGNGSVDPGDQIRYTIAMQNVGWVPAANVVVRDAIPANCQYVTNSTATNGVPIPDNSAPATPFPLDESGLYWGILDVGGTGSVSYTVEVISPFPSTADVVVANSAIFDSDIGGGGTQDPEPVNRGGLDITKGLLTTNYLYAGTTVTYMIKVSNSGATDQTMVRITDILPPGVVYVTNSTLVITPTNFLNVRDEFNAIAYTNQNGLANWLGAWQEVGEANGPSAGYIRVLTVWSSYQLRILRRFRFAQRFVNLSGATNAVLSFDYRRILMDPPDTVGIFASSNGGAAWVLIGTIVGRLGGASDTNTLSTNYNISAFISTNTGIRLGIPVPTAPGEGIAFDNVQINYYGAFPVTNAGTPPPVLADGYWLPPGGDMSVSFQVTVSDPITATQLVNKAVVLSADNPGGIPAWTTNLTAHTDLAVIKTVNNNSPNTNDLIGYTIVLTNRGPLAATNVVAYDLLPAGVSYVSHSQSQGSYSGVTGIWTAGTINAYGFATLWITGRVNAGTGGQTLTNTAWITGSSLFDPVTTNDTSSVPVTVTLCDLAVAKTVDIPSPATNQIVTFTIVVTNSGPNDATGVSISDLVPSGLTYENYAASSGAYNNVSGVWTVGTIQAGSSVWLTLGARVNAGTENTVITNRAVVLSLNQQEETLLNNTGVVSIAVNGLDIGVGKTASQFEPNTNETFTFRIFVTNFGPSLATGVLITDAVPVGVTYLGHTVSTGTYNSGTGVWDIGTLASGAVATLIISVRTDGGVCGEIITNTARLLWVDQGDYNPANNVSSAVIRVQSADLSIGKSADKTMVNPMDPVAFTVWLTNAGPSAATGVVVTDAVPANTTFSSYSASHGTYNSTSGIWSVGTLASGEVATLTLNVIVNSNLFGGSEIQNVARIVGSEQCDFVTANHSATATVQIVNAQLTGSKTAQVTEDPAYFGDTIAYTITVTNEGNITQTNLTVRDPVPSGSVYVADSCWVTAPRNITNTVRDLFSDVSYSNNYGNTNWIVPWDEAGTDDESPATGYVRIYVGNLRIGSLNRVARRMADLSGATNAVISFGWRRDGLDDVNDNVVLEISSNGYGGTWTEISRIEGPGTDSFFTETNINITAFAASNTAIRFRSSATLGAGDYVYLDNVKITWYGRYITTWKGTPPEILANDYELRTGETMIVQFSVTIQDPTTATQILNVASVTSAQHQTVLDLYATTRVARAELDVSKTVNNSTPVVGATIDYTIVVSNGGPQNAKGIVLTDLLPAALSYSNATPSQGNYNPTSGVWTVGNLNVGSVATLVLRAKLTNDDVYAGVAITNWASITGREQLDFISPNDSDYAVIIPKPTLAVITDFRAVCEDGEVWLEWQTAAEVGTLGFYVYRSEDGLEFKRVSEGLLPGLLTHVEGGTYRLKDRGARPGQWYSYRIEEVEIWGNRHYFGPYKVLVQPCGRSVRRAVSDRASADYHRIPRGLSAEKAARLARAAQSSVPRRSVRAAPKPANELKLIVKEKGIYGVDASTLAVRFGLSVDAVKSLISGYRLELSNRGQPVKYLAAKDGSRLYFYGEEAGSVYTDENVYWLRAGSATPPAILWGKRPAAASLTQHYQARRAVRREEVAAPALFQEDDADYWFWTYLIAGHPVFGQKSVEVTNEARATTGNASVTVWLMGGSKSGVPNEHHARIWVNGKLAGDSWWEGLQPHEWRVGFPLAWLSNGVNQIRVEAVLDTGVPYSVVYLKSVEVEYARYYYAQNNRLEGATPDANDVITVRGFTTSNILVVEVSNPRELREVRGVRISRQITGRYMASFRARRVNWAPVYAAFTPNSARSVERIEGVRVRGLTAATNRADYVVVTVSNLLTEAQALADYRAGQGYETLVVLVDDIYDVFGYGLKVPDALREFLRYAYRGWELAPSHVVLVGEGSFDHKNRLGYNETLIGPKMVGTPHGLFESDMWLGDVSGDDGSPEIVIGRLPVLTTGELANVIRKIQQYEAGGGDWARVVVLAADDPDEGGNFPADSDYLGGYVPGDYTARKIYLGQMPLSVARTTLRGAITNGAVLMNYIGHGAIDRLAQEGLLLNSDITALVNQNRNPALSALTCTVGHFAVPGADSLGELLLLAPDRGMIAVWSPSGLSMNEQARQLGEHFMAACFEDAVPTFGEMILQAMEDYRAAGEPAFMLRIYNLLGDPATIIR